jgi:hypothetical protein
MAQRIKWIADSPNPVTQASFRRQVWLQIYLPLLAGAAILGVLAFLLARGGVGQASMWADAAAVMLLVPVLVLILMGVALTVVLIVLLGRLIGWLPLPARQGQQLLARIASGARQGSELAVRPVMAIQGWRAALQAGVRLLASIVERE